MRVLVTGANGMIGHVLCPALALDGHQVVAAMRRPQSLNPSAPDPAISVQKITDIGPETSWTALLKGADAVVHLAARVHMLRDPAPDPLAAHRRVNVEGTKRLAEQAVAARVRRFVFLSSVKVHGKGPQPYREQDVPLPEDPYGVSKLEAEEALRKITHNTGVELVILRPPLVYGPGVKGNFRQLLRLCELGLPLPFGNIFNRRSLIGTDNLASAIGRCLTHPKAPGETFLVSDGEDVSTPDLARAIAKKMKKRIVMAPIPPALLEAMLWLIGKGGMTRRLLGSLTLDGRHIHDILNWYPPHSLDDGLQKTVAWYQNQRKSE
ncbi:MAG: hypothetical protein COA65_07125 [Rhodospirillaceae bacterium]|nr:MAG: hypothetical protein COA65_07125 [Rhodospirillaceae bacterium]